ncbi:hypothetical protein BCR44DRAFT_1270768 [Catenaria anguillulae PL171]|uniref:Uncharacterized protein n=1 Tax=Catenaria anguillulae PL171 TaxID=765915 RepID=A0A1Y2HXC5_9FUNG|nr:hypothetical protein BCR44DRAFT_1270768 [Catenaria anguillulae PL171]
MGNGGRPLAVLVRVLVRVRSRSVPLATFFPARLRRRPSLAPHRHSPHCPSRPVNPVTSTAATALSRPSPMPLPSILGPNLPLALDRLALNDPRIIHFAGLAPSRNLMDPLVHVRHAPHHVWMLVPPAAVQGRGHGLELVE